MCCGVAGVASVAGVTVSLVLRCYECRRCCGVIYKSFDEQQQPQRPKHQL